MPQVTEVVKLRRRVLTEIARLAFEAKLKQDVDSILYTVVTEEGPRYRCCVYKERAVLKERIKLALSQPSDLEINEAVENALRGKIADMPVINIMPVACDQCPIDKFIVTNACRNCLAHHCINSCPKQAIMVVQNRAYIDKNKCVECGMCKKSCPYGAIIEVNRPCESACDLGAIKAGKDRCAEIDYDKCVQCGSCKTACPFGAISDRSAIVQLIQAIKAGKKVYAVLAPAFIGQFGAKVKPSQVVEALKKMGFYAVAEVSLGADIVTLEETKEFTASVPRQRKYMTTSCCPAFVSMIGKHLPAETNSVSTTVSPMIAIGKVVKQREPDAVVVFVGPCTAKKAEAEQYEGIIDYVITFEELACMMVGAGLNMAKINEAVFETSASRDGNSFAKAGGVMQSVMDMVDTVAPGTDIRPQSCEGLQNCMTAIQQIISGKSDINFIEGMACEGGCVGGPGVLTNMKVTGKLVENFSKSAKAITAGENEFAAAEVQSGVHWHRE
ncbi:MAG: 4Fe-4S dicluster domain-containing protein [Veillonellales bacterium]